MISIVYVLGAVASVSISHHYTPNGINPIRLFPRDVE